ncbi:hypothetical protein EVAR_83612_1 [Eumeta japonica]|uniref:Uncharacterized protein n=1 Tax=Eumeta variegata TaxID=151549 RepID=A0A4C1UNG1_EUMVA|nr:hypothetical protein EVAR_83612_1 [Eumeta japonica]
MLSGLVRLKYVTRVPIRYPRCGSRPTPQRRESINVARVQHHVDAIWASCFGSMLRMFIEFLSCKSERFALSTNWHLVYLLGSNHSTRFTPKPTLGSIGLSHEIYQEKDLTARIKEKV